MRISTQSLMWAKKQEIDSKYYWLPLDQHLLDTSNVIVLLWNHWLSKGQIDVIVRSLSTRSEEDAFKLTQFLGAIHDIGKATPAFQKQESFHHSEDLDIRLLLQLENFGFKDLSNLALTNAKKSKHALAGQVILQNYGFKEDITAIVGGHHGKPVDEKRNIIEQRAYPENYYQEENNELLKNKWQDTQKDIILWAMEVSGFQDINEVPSISQSGAVLLSGLLIMADWIASNDRFFPLFDLDFKHEINQKEREMSGWSKWQKTFSWNPHNFSDMNQVYADRFKFKPRDVQSKISSIINDCLEPGIFVIEAPMGLGKTEIALVAVEQLNAKTSRSGMFFGLPTQATSNGIFPRITDWLSKLSITDNQSKQIQLVHGKSYLNKEFSNLKYITKRSVNQDEDDSVIVNDWFAGRKTAILDDFVVGTVDHFLMSSLKQPHLALRHLGLSKKVIVIDEVHAYDAYMSQYLNQSVRWMGAYGVPVVILSATLPISRRNELIKNYVAGQGYHFKREIIKPEDWDCNESYPLLSYSDGNVIKQFSNFEKIQDKVIQVEKLQDSSLVEVVESKSNGQGIIGIILNTVKKAQTVAIEMIEKFGEDNVELLHSAFIATDRVTKEQELLKTIGKGGDRPKFKIIIGTQVIEQSLDIDFDLLITDLSPMDLLIQRIGRLHRHQIDNRPQSLKEPKVIVLGTSDNYEFDSGSSAVYGDYLLIRTQHYLPEQIKIPSDVSSLVQKVYDGNEIVIDKHLAEVYERAKLNNEQLIDSKKTRARSFRLDNPTKRDETLVGFLKDTRPEGGGEMGFAQVRDSSDTIEVICVKRNGNSYSLFGETDLISERIEEPSAAMKLANQTLKLPNILSAIYNIDETIRELEKLNNRLFPQWQRNPWLKGTLGILFDENNNAEVGGFLLNYDVKLGLNYTKIERSS